MRNIAISLAYDGSAYHGWQIQQNFKTVQGTLQKTVELITQEPIKIVGCGRTDAGVHARRYIAGFHTNCQIPCDRVARALNSVLPKDITVFNAEDAPVHFHPIRSCIKKEYTYEIYTSAFRDPFSTTRALHYEGNLPILLMREAASYFIGTHDFASMRSMGTNVKSTVRTVYSFDIIEHENGISLVVCADGFLYNMARTMVGTLLSVAQGKISPLEISTILMNGDRKRAGITAPAHALYMTDVWFDTISI